MERIMDQGGDADFDTLPLWQQSAPEQQQELLALYNEMSDRHPDPRNWNTASRSC